MSKNARFWIYEAGGFVKITLRPGQELTHVEGGPHEEGYSYTATTWIHCGDYVECSVSSWGQDCDGRHGTNNEYTCDLDQLDKGGERFANEIGEPIEIVKLPHWVHGERSQYDEFAESMGY